MAIRLTVHRFVWPHTVVLRHRPDASVQILKMRKDTLVLFDLDFNPTEYQVRSHWNDECIIDVEGKELFRFVGVVNIQRKSGYIILRGSHI